MSEELKTIKELADELGVNKQNVQYHIKSLPNKERLKNEKGIILLTIDEQNFIRAKILKISTDKVLTDKVSTDKISTDKENNFLIEKIKIQEEQIRDLKEQRRNGKEQLDIKDSQIAQMQNLLDQQQRLALQDKKLLDEYKSEINDLKALKMPTQDTKVEQVSSKQPQEVESVAEEPKKAPRKWWKLW